MNKKKKILFLTGLAVLMAGLGLATSYLLFCGEKTQTTEISYIKGDVQYKAVGGAWSSAWKDLQLMEGSSIKVLGEGLAAVELVDGSAVRLNSDSQVTLTKLSDKEVAIANDKGDVYVRVAKSNNRTFLVSAGEYVYKALGTAFRVFNTEKKKGVEVYESDVKILKGEKEVIKVEEGKKYYYLFPEDKEKEKKLQQISIPEKDEFLMWNKEQDEQNDKYKKDLGILEDIKMITKPTASKTTTKTKTATLTPSWTPTVKAEEPTKEPTLEPTVEQGSILLVGSSFTSSLFWSTIVSPSETPNAGINFTWTVNGGLDVSKGFKLIKAKHANPVYPGDEVQYYSSSAREATWYIYDGGTYHFRVCQYLGGACGVYSNDVTITAPFVPTYTPTFTSTATVTYTPTP